MTERDVARRHNTSDYYCSQRLLGEECWWTERCYVCRPETKETEKA